jgi:hypothetical protein
VELTTHPHLPPRLKKEYSYTSTPPLGLRGRLWGELYLYHGQKIEEDTVDRACSTDLIYEKCTQNFKQKSRKQKITCKIHLKMAGYY